MAGVPEAPLYLYGRRKAVIKEQDKPVRYFGGTTSTPTNHSKQKNMEARENTGQVQSAEQPEQEWSEVCSTPRQGNIPGTLEGTSTGPTNQTTCLTMQAQGIGANKNSINCSKTWETMTQTCTLNDKVNFPARVILNPNTSLPTQKAQRRKFRKLIDHGVSQEEASKLCVMPWPDIYNKYPLLKEVNAPQKQTFEDSQLSLKKAPKLTSDAEKQTSPSNCHQEAICEGSAKEFISEEQYLASKNIAPLRIGIKNSVPMNEDQMKLVHRHLIIAITEQFTSRGPEFIDFAHKSGWILVTCVDQRSLDWLVKEVLYLEPWPGAQLTAIPEHELPCPPKVVVLIPASEADTIQEALALLRAQNKGLNTELWKVLHERVEKSKNRNVTFIIDEESLDTLRAQNNQVYLGFTMVTFRIKAGGSKFIRPHPPATQNQDPGTPTAISDSNTKLKNSGLDVTCSKKSREADPSKHGKPNMVQGKGNSEPGMASAKVKTSPFTTQLKSIGSKRSLVQGSTSVESSSSAAKRVKPQIDTGRTNTHPKKSQEFESYGGRNPFGRSSTPVSKERFVAATGPVAQTRGTLPLPVTQNLQSGKTPFSHGDRSTSQGGPLTSTRGPVNQAARGRYETQTEKAGTSWDKNLIPTHVTSLAANQQTSQAKSGLEDGAKPVIRDAQYGKNPFTYCKGGVIDLTDSDDYGTKGQTLARSNPHYRGGGSHADQSKLTTLETVSGQPSSTVKRLMSEPIRFGAEAIIQNSLSQGVAFVKGTSREVNETVVTQNATLASKDLTGTVYGSKHYSWDIRDSQSQPQNSQVSHENAVTTDQILMAKDRPLIWGSQTYGSTFTQYENGTHAVQYQDRPSSPEEEAEGGYSSWIIQDGESYTEIPCQSPSNTAGPRGSYESCRRSPISQGTRESLTNRELSLTKDSIQSPSEKSYVGRFNVDSAPERHKKSFAHYRDVDQTSYKFDKNMSPRTRSGNGDRYIKDSRHRSPYTQDRLRDRGNPRRPESSSPRARDGFSRRKERVPFDRRYRN